MKDRAFKVAFTYLAQTPDPMKDKNKDKDKPEQIQESEMRKIIKEELSRGYAALLGSYFRQLDAISLISAGDYALRHYSPTGIPRQDFTKELYKYKNYMLASLKDLAFEDKNSITDQVVDFVKNSTEKLNKDEIAIHTRGLLLKIRKDTRSYMRRMLTISEKPLQ